MICFKGIKWNLNRSAKSTWQNNLSRGLASGCLFRLGSTGPPPKSFSWWTGTLYAGGRKVAAANDRMSVPLAFSEKCLTGRRDGGRSCRRSTVLKWQVYVTSCVGVELRRLLTGVEQLVLHLVTERSVLFVFPQILWHKLEIYLLYEFTLKCGSYNKSHAKSCLNLIISFHLDAKLIELNRWQRGPTIWKKSLMFAWNQKNLIRKSLLDQVVLK